MKQKTTKQLYLNKETIQNLDITFILDKDDQKRVIAGGLSKVGCNNTKVPIYCIP